MTLLHQALLLKLFRSLLSRRLSGSFPGFLFLLHSDFQDSMPARVFFIAYILGTILYTIIAALIKLRPAHLLNFWLVVPGF